MIKFLTKQLMKWAESKGRIFKITGTAGPEDVYLIRYYIIKSRYFNFFIHQFLRSDRDDLHDHPWNFCTYLVSGAYTEVKYNTYIEENEVIRRTNYKHFGRPIKLNTLVFRNATDLHQVKVDRDLRESEKEQAALTLFFSGPTKRDWGFVKDGKWIKWTTYLGLPDDTPTRG